MVLCKHFGTCGGCSYQDMPKAEYAIYKKNIVVSALVKNGLEYIITNDPIIMPAHTRRRINLKALRLGNKVILGYHERRSHNIVDMLECHLVVPTIENVLPIIRQMLMVLLKPKQKADVYIAHTDTGLDVLFSSDQWASVDLDQNLHIIKLAQDHNLARLSLASKKGREPVVTFRTPTVRYGTNDVEIDADGFMQATHLSNQVLTEFVMNATPGSMSRAVDLFCGRGTFSLPLANQTKVDAYELDKPSVLALERAKNKSSLAVNVIARNLFEDPLSPQELGKYAYAVINPPRAGALKQCQNLAASKVPTITMVSCDPRTFARDARELINGGYVLNGVTPVDQFLWSDHLEVAGTFRRQT